MVTKGNYINAKGFTALAIVVSLIIPGIISLPLTGYSDNIETRSGLEVVISELAPHGSGFQGEDWIELLVVEGSGDISPYVLSSFDSLDDDESFANSTVTVNAGERLVVHYNGSVADETDITGDSNGNGYVDMYIGGSELSRTHEQAALYTALDYSVMVDAVCWSKGDITASEATDAQNLVDLGMWPSNSASDMVYSADIDKGISLARKEGKDDSDNASDWYVETNSSPGASNKFFNFTGEVILIGAYISGSPKAFTIKVVRGGGDVSCLSISDLDRAPVFLATEPVTLAQDDELKLIFGTGTNETDATGDFNQNGVRELFTDQKNSPTGTTDAAVLFNGLAVLDAVAWCTDGKLSSGEISDLEFLISRKVWNGNTSEDCVNVSVMGTNNELVRSEFNDTDSKADWTISGEINTDIDLKEFDYETFQNIDSVTCGVSPDSSFWLLAGLIENATERIQIEVYILDNFKIAEKLMAALERNVEIKILLEGAPVGGVPDMEKYIMELITEKGGEVRYIITDSDAGISERFTNVHSKFMVVDGNKTFITSENFREIAIPYYGTKGNRGWCVVVDSAEVGEYFGKVFSYDFSPTSPDSFPFTPGHDTYGGPSAAFDPKSQKPTDGKYEKVFKNQEFTGDISVSPVLCPDHTGDFQAIIPLIEGAKKTIWVQQHSVNDYWKEGSKYISNKYLDSLLDAARRGVEVRIQLDETWKKTNDHWGIINETNEIARTEELDLVAKFTSNDDLNIQLVHNKGIIVDGEKVLVSSINWATNSIYNNREAGVIIENEEVADYYAKVFLLDWGVSDIGVIKGIVTDPDGNPIGGAEVKVEGTGFSEISESDGSFIIDDVPPGSYFLKVTATGFDEHSQGVEVELWLAANVTCIMGSWGAIEGIVMDINGEPIEGVKVTIEGTQTVTYTNDKGRYRIDKAPVGKYYLTITLTEYQDLLTQVDVEKGKTYEAESTIQKEGSSENGGKESNKPPLYLLLILGVILIMVLVIFSAIMLNARKVREQEKGKTVTRISGDQHPFDDKVDKEP